VSARGARRFAWTIAILAFTLVAAAGSLWAFEVLSGSHERPFYWEDAAAGVVLPLIGAVVLHHRPRNRIGWVILTMGLAGAISIAGEQYAYHAAVAAPGSLPAAAFVAWVATWVWFPTYGLVPLVLLLFPDGPPEGWWRRLVPATIAVCALVVVSMAVHTAHDPLHFALAPDADPLVDPGISGIAMAAGMLLSLVLVVLGITSLLLRWRHADALRRAQMRWVVTSVSVGIGLFVAKSALTAVFTGLPGWIHDGLGVVGVSVMLLGIPIAIIRYRLYEIDRIISRTVSYGLVMLTLVGIYVLGVVGLGALVRGIAGGGGGDLVVAASTLAVAAAFGPLRRRVQDVVDRRFNRARYDAAREIERFGGRLRDEVDLTMLEHDLVETAYATLRPTHATLWMPPTAGVER
jgi:hypothetical protein